METILLPPIQASSQLFITHDLFLVLFAVQNPCWCLLPLALWSNCVPSETWDCVHLAQVLPASGPCIQHYSVQGITFISYVVMKAPWGWKATTSTQEVYQNDNAVIKEKWWFGSLAWVGASDCTRFFSFPFIFGFEKLDVWSFTTNSHRVPCIPVGQTLWNIYWYMFLGINKICDGMCNQFFLILCPLL